VVYMKNSDNEMDSLKKIIKELERENERLIKIKMKSHLKKDLDTIKELKEIIHNQDNIVVLLTEKTERMCHKCRHKEIGWHKNPCKSCFKRAGLIDSLTDNFESESGE